MSEAAAPPSPPPHGSVLIARLIRLTALLGVAVTAMLAYQSWTADPLPGCGGEAGCEALLAGRWAYWLSPRVPVALLGLLAWLGVGVAAWGPKLARLRFALAVMVAGAAAWFVVVQAGFVQQWCPYCLAAHACAAALLALVLLDGRGVSVLGVVLPGLAVAALVGGQLAWPVTTDHLVAHAAADDDTPVEAQRLLRTGGLEINPAEFPRLGPADAPHVVLSFSDYTCDHCMVMHGHLAAARDRYGGQLAVATAPAPINTFCNAHVPFTPAAHRNACRLAKMALAVWLADPAAFPAMHNYLFEAPGREPRRPADARAFAVSQVGEAAFVAALGGDAIDELLRRTTDLNYRIGHALDPPVDNVLPKLVLGDDRVIVRRPPSRQALFDQLEAALGLVPAPPDAGPDTP